MRIGSVGGYGFDPYRDYTTALQKSIRFASPQMDSSTAQNSQTDRAPVEEVMPESAGNDYAKQSDVQAVAASNRPSPAIMEALRSVRQMTEDVTNAAANPVSTGNSSKQDIRSMISEMEDFQLYGSTASATRMEETSNGSSRKGDSILQEYQYFVSPAEETNHLEQDGIFFAKTY